MSIFTSHLKMEHVRILRLLERLSAACARLAETKLEYGWVREILAAVDALEVLVERQHHAKEERLLFPCLLASGRLENGGPRCTYFMDLWLLDRATRPAPPLPQTTMERSPLGIPLEEHRRGHELLSRLRTLAENPKNDVAWLKRVLETASEYKSLLTTHIEKEDTCLFVLADRILNAEDQARLLRQADAFDLEAQPLTTGTGN